MLTFPSIPGWNGMHPVVVQFAVVLLFTAPLLLLLSLFARRSWRTWTGAALLLMGLGSLAAWFAVGTGHAAGQLVDKTPALALAIAQHEALGMLTRTVFTILTLVFGALLLTQSAIRKSVPDAFRISVHAVFLVVYLICALSIANAADRGGRLVHQYGLQAMVERESQQANAVNASAKPPAAGIQGASTEKKE
jgi:uncharacterized membrane protein